MHKTDVLPLADIPASPVAAIRAMAPELEACREEIDRDRSLPASLVARLAEAGFFRMLTPQALGGWELDLPAALEVIEAASAIEGALGWLLMIGNGGGFAGALPNEGAQAIFGADPNAIACGALAPLGRAEVLEGGFRVDGRWPFVSGCMHATWLGNGCVVFENGKPRRRADGSPETRIVFFPRGDFAVHDTWNVTGLRGTGSHDVSVKEIFVPETHSFEFPPLSGTKPTYAGPLYAFPVRSLLAAAVAAIPLGLARRAVEEAAALAGKKKSYGTAKTLSESPGVQADIARSEAALESAAMLFHSRARCMWETVAAGRKPDIRDRALLMSAIGHAAQTACEVANLMHRIAGTTGIYAAHPLERVFRDMHVATKHVLLAPGRLETAGQVILGQPLSPSAII